MAEQQSMVDEAARRALKEDLAKFHCRVQQPDDPPLFTRTVMSSSCQWVVVPLWISVATRPPAQA